jgi:hypothetical protein
LSELPLGSEEQAARQGGFFVRWRTATADAHVKFS